MEDRLERIQAGERQLLVYRNRPRSLYGALSRSAHAHPDNAALIAGDERISYRELLRRVDVWAERLVRDFRLSKGDRVGLLYPNAVPFCELLLASAKTGAIAVLLNAKLTARELAYIVGHSGCAVLFYDTAFEHKIAQLAPMVPDVRFVPSDGSETAAAAAGDNAAGSGAGVPAALGDIAAGSGVDAPAPLGDNAVEDDPCYLMYTSGTTGIPKGAVTTHRNVIHSAMNYCSVCGTTSADTTIIAIPLFHVTGLIGQLLHMLMLGGTSILLREYSTNLFLEAAIRHRVTFMFNVPAIYNMLLLREETARIGSLRLAMYGGAPMTPETISKLRALFPGLALLNAYGATETSSPATIMPIGWPSEKIASVGKPVPGADIRIMDGNGSERSADEVGELWIAGAMVITEYWDNEAANRSSFAGVFWKSGDMAMIDSDGYVYIMDRMKDLINRGGEKIYSIEIEAVLGAHPGVSEAAVVGVPDEIFGEQIKAYIVPKDGATLDEEQIKSYVKTYLAPYKVPKYVAFIGAIPRNPGGKIMKQLLRSEHAMPSADERRRMKEGSDAG